MNILDEIIAHKHVEVKENKENKPIKILKQSPYFTAPTVSLKKYILHKDLSGIIAEFKRKSPSKGMINEYADSAAVCSGYVQAGASALSVITDSKYFGGCNKDLTDVRNNINYPILRKEFIVDEYQVIEARSIGANAILLIAEALSREQLKALSQLAYELQMEVLFEVHDRQSIDKLPQNAEIVGINNRNLKNLNVNIENSLNLVNELPASAVKIAESGIDSPETAMILKKAGFSGFLIGELFMHEVKPEKACKVFIEKLKK